MRKRRADCSMAHRLPAPPSAEAMNRDYPPPDGWSQWQNHPLRTCYGDRGEVRCFVLPHASLRYMGFLRQGIGLVKTHAGSLTNILDAYWTVEQKAKEMLGTEA